jgi:hypothetical protein
MKVYDWPRNRRNSEFTSERQNYVQNLSTFMLEPINLYIKGHVTSNKANSNLECAEDKFQTRGWVQGCEKWKAAGSGQNRVVSMKHEGSVSGRTSVKKLLPPQAMRGNLTRNAGPCSKLCDTCYKSNLVDIYFARAEKKYIYLHTTDPFAVT